MFIYLIAPIIVILFGLLINNKKIIFKDRDVTRYFFCSIAFLLPLYIFAFRSITIGTDTESYCRAFQLVSLPDLLLFDFDNNYEFEFGFIIFMSLLSCISSDPLVLLIGSSLLMNYLYGRVIIKQANLFITATLVYLFLGNFLYNLTMMRQAIAVGIFLNAIPYLLKRKFEKYCILVALAASFHIFSVVGVLLILPVVLVKNRKQLIFTIIMAAVVILTSLEIVHEIVYLYFPHFDYYFRNDYNSEQEFGLTSIGYVMIEMITVMIMINRYKIKGVNGNKVIVYSLALTFAAMGLIMMPTFGIYERIAKYFQPFLILAIPFALESVNNKYLRLVSLMFIVGYSFIYYAYIIYTNPYRIVPFVPY